MSRSIIFSLLFIFLNISNMSLAGGEKEGGGFLHLALEWSDIEMVSVNDEVWIKLVPVASDELERITESNIGKPLLVTLDGLEAVKATVAAPITSGVIGVASPSNELLMIIKKYIEENKIQQKKVN